MTILDDPVRPFDPSPQLELLDTEPEADARAERPEARAERPEPLGDAYQPALGPPGPEGMTFFGLASRGGYVRNVTGTVAYLDEQAETYMVLADGELLRVPLRDITARHEVAAIREIDRSPDGDAEGLGTA
jgi:hypothetical protein